MESLFPCGHKSPRPGASEEKHACHCGVCTCTRRQMSSVLPCALPQPERLSPPHNCKPLSSQAMRASSRLVWGVGSFIPGASVPGHGRSTRTREVRVREPVHVQEVHAGVSSRLGSENQERGVPLLLQGSYLGTGTDRGVRDAVWVHIHTYVSSPCPGLKAPGPSCEPSVGPGRSGLHRPGCWGDVGFRLGQPAGMRSLGQGQGQEAGRGWRPVWAPATVGRTVLRPPRA